MLFNSYGFIFLFLPAALLGFFQLARLDHRYAAAWLALASLIFYGYWNPAYVGLLLGSVIFNYVCGIWIAKTGRHGNTVRKKLLIFSIVANLSLLGYYKYAHFFLDNVNSLTGSDFSLGTIILPLGISFFTFTQIAFLIDTYQGKVKEYNFVHYLLFVTYFPHLIAGPILHHKEMMPQFSHASTYRFNYENFAVGLTIFIIGLFKKVIIADGIAQYVGPIFDAPGAGVHLTFIEAWGGALSYAFQLYFDFSGYSDMAIGLSRLFGVTLPLNFHSPYKAINIIDFWQRWHMTLTRYIKDYLYTPITLACTRIGFGKPAAVEVLYSLVIPTISIFLVLGLWHGANWTFVVFGAMHGVMIVVNHLWRMRPFLKHDKKKPPSLFARMSGWALTFAGVNIAFVMFRADNFAVAASFYQSMLGGNGLFLPDSWFSHQPVLHLWLAQHGWFAPSNGLAPSGMANWIWILLLIVLLAPNTQQIMQNFKPALGIPSYTPATRLAWRPSIGSAAVIWLLGLIAVINLNKVSAFLYFQF
jgi:D-alanyl-lipoteichoic acid acyltransferase DltB (MBOAT superfamily)